MHEIYELKEKLMKELGEYGSQEMTAGSLQVIDTLAHTIKNLCKIIEAAEEEEGGSSYRGSSYYGGSSREGGRGSSRAGYESGQSRARGRGRNARRDSMGRYSSYDMGGSSRYEGSSRYDGGSYADGVEQMVDSIREMMGELPQNVQQDAQRFVQKLEQVM